MSTPGTEAVAPERIAAAQRRTIATLVAAQAVGAMGITIGIATASVPGVLIVRRVAG